MQPTSWLWFRKGLHLVNKWKEVVRMMNGAGSEERIPVSNQDRSELKPLEQEPNCSVTAVDPALLEMKTALTDSVSAPVTESITIITFDHVIPKLVRYYFLYIVVGKLRIRGVK